MALGARMFTRTRYIAVVVTLLYLSAGTVQPAYAVGRPAGLSAKAEPTAVVLSWRPVPGADSYRVQLSGTSTFNSVLWDEDVTATMATPIELVSPGTLYWRVAAEQDRRLGPWTSAKISVPRSSSPIPVAPSDGAVLTQPDDAVLLEWESLPGAQSYQVEIDGADGDWVGSTTYETSLTSYAPIEATPGGKYFWRVRGILGEGNLTSPSTPRSFTLGELPAVALKKTEALLEDVVLEWDPQPGAVRYEIRVSTDDDFNVITDQRYVAGTRYSPPQTYDNASYWWQVRAVNVDGRAEEWSSQPDRIGTFRRHWPHVPTRVAPASGASMAGDAFLEWTPVPQASAYELQIGTDESFSSDRSFTTCVTTQTTFTPGAFNGDRSLRDGCRVVPSATNFWRVRPLDNHEERNKVNGSYSAIGSFTVQASEEADPANTPGTVMGQRVLLTGSSSASCVGTVGGVPCTEVPSTPMLDWDPVAGASFYQLYLAHDLRLTNMVRPFGDLGSPDALVWTTNTRFMPRIALPDTQAGEAYYWFVRACSGTPRSPKCSLTPETASHAFQKKSPPVELVSPADAAQVADAVTLTWRDYLATNGVSTQGSLGEPGQSASQYRLQVATSASFTEDTLVDDRRVDQTTYTAFDRAYPEGRLYWRVQAVDGSENELSWSVVRSFTKLSPAPQLRAPEDATTVSGLRGLRWRPLVGAKYYDVEIYANNDVAASPSNLVAFGKNIRQALFTPPRPLAAAATPYVWRVRRSDYSDNKGAWSSWRRFTVAPPAPRILGPGSAARTATTLFRWTAPPGAASFRWELRRKGSAATIDEVTQQTAWVNHDRLMRGRYTWRIVALDNQRKELSSSAWTPLRVR